MAIYNISVSSGNKKRCLAEKERNLVAARADAFLAVSSRNKRREQKRLERRLRVPSGNKTCSLREQPNYLTKHNDQEVK